MKKGLLPIILVFGLLIFVLFTPVVTSVYIRGPFWSTIDNTLVTTVEGNNVNIGSNETTLHKLNVDGTMMVDGQLTINGKMLLANGVFYSMSGNGFDCNVPAKLGDGSTYWNFTVKNLLGIDFPYLFPENLFDVGLVENGLWLTQESHDNTAIGWFSDSLATRYFMSYDDSIGSLKLDSTVTNPIFDIDIPVDISSDRPILELKDESARVQNEVIMYLNDSNGNNLMNWSYSGTNAMDLEMRFGDRWNTKIGFPDNNYYAFKNDLTEIWLGGGAVADPRLYFNFYVGEGEDHGRQINPQFVNYYTDDFKFAVDTAGGGQRWMQIIPNSVIGEQTEVNFAPSTDGIKFNGFVNITDTLQFDNIHYAEMYYHNDVSPNVTSIAVQDIWYNVSSFNQSDNGEKLNGFTRSGSSLICVQGGRYDFSYKGSVSGTVNNKYHFAVGLNGVPQQINTESHTRSGTANDIDSATGGGYVDLISGDQVTLQVMNEDAGNDITIYSMNINCERIGS